MAAYPRLTTLQKRALLGCLLAALLVEYLPLPYSFLGAREASSGERVTSFGGASYNVAAFEVHNTEHTISEHASASAHAQHAAAATSEPAAAATAAPASPPSPAPFVARQQQQRHAHGTCARTPPLPNSVVELMKASNRTVHMLNQGVRHQLEETQRQLETQTAQLRQAQDEVQRLQRQLAVQQDRAAQQEPQQCDGQDRLRELESKLEVKRRELASQQEAVKASQEALEKQRSSQVQVEYQLGVRQQELDEKTAALAEKAKRHAIELAALEQRHAAELAERHSRLSKCGASLGSATAALEERERQVTLSDKRIKELEQQLAEHKRQEKTRAAESAEKLKAAQKALKAAQEEAALELAAAQKALSDERQAHQRTAEALAATQAREKRHALEAAAELARVQRQLTDKEEVLVRQRQQLQELTEENNQLNCKLDSSETAIDTLEQHLVSLNQAMEATTA